MKTWSPCHVPTSDLWSWQELTLKPPDRHSLLTVAVRVLPLCVMLLYAERLYVCGALNEG